MSNVMPMRPAGGPPMGGDAPADDMGGAPDAGAEGGFPGIDPKNPIAGYIMGNLDQQDMPTIQALASMTPAVASALAKIIPEVAPLFQWLGGTGDPAAMPGMGGGAAAPPAPGGGAPPMPGGGSVPPPAPGGGPPRPRTALGNL